LGISNESIKGTDNIRESSLDAGATLYVKYMYKRLHFVFCRKAAAVNKWLIAHPDAKIDGAFNGIKGENLSV
jgi:hypothetical protein